MGASNFSEAELAGESERYAHAVKELKQVYGFDFVSIGLTAFIGAPLKWIYSASATGERYRRIVLAPGHGIGGIVIKAGKPMMFVDIDAQIDPREYSSYPIVFAEDLHSFCALPLAKGGRVVGALLCAFRTVSDGHESVYMSLVRGLDGRLCDFDVVSSDFIDFRNMAAQGRSERGDGADSGESELSRVIGAQEAERKRISRELHDGIAQEMLGVSFLLNRVEPYLDEPEARSLLAEARENMDRILDDLHNLSVELRPSALDHLGFVPALRSQAAVFERTYGARIDFDGSLSVDRFDRALETQAYRRMDGSARQAPLQASQWMQASRSNLTFTCPTRPSTWQKPPSGQRARHHTRLPQNSSASTTATSVASPATDPNRMPLLMAPIGENASNSGKPTRADTATTPTATPTLAWRGTGASRTSMPSLRLSASTPSSSRFAGHTQPQNVRPRTSP